MFFDLASDTLNHTKIRHGAVKQRGASHGDELSYLFSNAHSQISRGSVEFDNVQKVVGFVGDFAKGSYHQLLKAIEKTDLPHNYEALLIQEPEWKIDDFGMMERFYTYDSLYREEELF